MIGLSGRSELKADYLMQLVMKCNSTFREMMPAFRENSVLQPFMHSCYYSLSYLCTTALVLIFRETKRMKGKLTIE